MPDINLRQMKKDQSGIIATINVGGELGLRMREMGLVPGTKITIQGRAPLNDPVALRVMGGILTLRNNEADHIIVTVDDSDEKGPFS
jgi:ferrous iron transport protein A